MNAMPSRTLASRPYYLPIGNEEKVFGPGDVLLFPSGFWHGATMLDEAVILVDIFSPRLSRRPCAKIRLGGAMPADIRNAGQ